MNKSDIGLKFIKAKWQEAMMSSASRSCWS
jgi:hypothetical protein